MRPFRSLAAWLHVLALLFSLGCETDEEDFGIDEELTPGPPMGKEDGPGRPGPRVATDTRATQVWIARNAWEDRDTPAARRGGLAWDVDSGLTWDEKYARWIAGLEEVASPDGHRTIRLTTPWGKSVPAPVLECAEAAIFLRATFAAWYELPFFLEAIDGQGVRVFFGHFGVRTATARYARTPEFARTYDDYSRWNAADLARRGWPRDKRLRVRHAAGGSDEQPDLGAGAAFGAYLDELHLNKRAGHLIIYLLNYFGSANLADSANTYNLTPEAIHAGDLLLHRWQRRGIGDTKVLKAVDRRAGTMSARLMSGSMPRRRPKLYDAIASKGYFTSDDTGGPGMNADGDAYARLGGGVKRWRVTRNVGGRWTNTWMTADEASWIHDGDLERLAARPIRFRALLGEVAPAVKLDALLHQIDDAREHLAHYPASCAARERRERAFRELYELAPRLGLTSAEIDRRYRGLEDWVYAELTYTRARTCCWNSTTTAMADVVMDLAAREQDSQCRTPTVFRAQSDGYARWREHARRLGRGEVWKEWTEDEPCAARTIAEDEEAPRVTAAAWCE